ncbi:hypothetical protein [Chitinophaga cymbidii]|uniref:Cytochrome c domain-containing protein n=1 Tax=Chitinophaga cymbidii TaxID=1096750 RepID=A0A512RHM4_9BACT|nr:hypothetical protein [Chitinophaga cymbidii]GEP95164.1 hypothetical protein CCY01nite_14240 [Chitinophaga cymbidii]
MRAGIFFLAAIATTLISVITGQRARQLPPEVKHVLQWYYLQAKQLDKEAGLLLEAVEQQDSQPEIQQQFLEARFAYKRLELLATHFHPSGSMMLNDPGIEKMLFPRIAEQDTANLRKAVLQLISGTRLLQRNIDSLETGDAELFDAMRLEIARILAFGISGVDSPVAGESITETKYSLAGIKAVWLFYKEKLEKRNPDLADRTLALFVEADRILDTSSGQTFSRMDFIRDYLNPLAIQIKLAREALKIPYATADHFLDPAASNVFAKGAFNLSGEEWGMNSRFDQFMRGDDSRMDAREVNGFNLFMGKAKCGTCHFVPLFNGETPFAKGEDHKIIPASAIRNSTGNMHHFQHLNDAEQRDVLAFVQTLQNAEIATSR